MDMLIKISDAAFDNIRSKADQEGRPAEELVQDVVEHTFADGDDRPRAREHNLLAFAGMFSGGPGDTAERAPEILRSEFGNRVSNDR